MCVHVSMYGRPNKRMYVYCMYAWPVCESMELYLKCIQKLRACRYGDGYVSTHGYMNNMQFCNKMQ